MKGEFCYFNAFIFKLVQELFCKMKSGGRSGSRTGIFGINSLITLRIVKLFVNIGRKRNSSCFIEDLFPHTFEFETDYPVAALENLLAFGFELTGNKSHPFAFADFFARACQGFPMVIVNSLQEKELDRALRIRTDA